MKITDPVLVPGISAAVDHINAREFEEAGCASVVVGLYPTKDAGGVKTLSPVSRLAVPGSCQPRRACLASLLLGRPHPGPDGTGRLVGARIANGRSAH